MLSVDAQGQYSVSLIQGSLNHWIPESNGKFLPLDSRNQVSAQIPGFWN
jgi:hypothetical protein